MARQAKRINVKLSPEAETLLREKAEKILRNEKAEISSWARELRQREEAAAAELKHTAELLKSERQAQGLSLADMQKRTGIDRAVLCRLENLVDANPTVATLERIAKALGKRLIVGLQD